MSTSCQASMACGVYLLSRVFLSPSAPLLSSKGQPLPPGMSSHRGPCSVLSCFSQVQLFATLWTVVCQAPLSIGFLQQEYWSVLPCLPPGDLPTKASILLPSAFFTVQLSHPYMTPGKTIALTRRTFPH